MCRQYILSFTDCGHRTPPRQEHLFRCSRAQHCPLPQIVYKTTSRYCDLCLIGNYNTEPHQLRPSQPHRNTEPETRFADGILSWAAPANQRNWHECSAWYDAWYIHFFSDDLGEYPGLGCADYELLFDIEKAVMTRIYDVWDLRLNPGLTYNMLMLYLQLRDALLSAEILYEEDTTARREQQDAAQRGESVHDKMIARLPDFVRPVSVHNLDDDERDCLICTEEFGKPQADGGATEWPVRVIDCGHLYGRKCLEQWIRSWDDPDRPFYLCTLCKKDTRLQANLDVVPDWEDNIPSPEWLEALRAYLWRLDCLRGR